MAEGIQSPNPRTSSSWALFPPRLELHLISEDESNLACGLTNSNIYIVTTSKRDLGGACLVRYWGPTENFVLVRTESSSKLQSDCSDQFIQGGSDRLVEFVELMQPIGSHGSVSWIGMKKPGGERCVDLVEEFEKQQTDAISIGQEPIATRVWQLFHQTFGTQLPQFITKCTRRALFGSYSEGLGRSHL